MWIYLNNSFVALTSHEQFPDCLFVRSRVRGDIERLFGSGIKPNHTPGPNYDYAFRVALARNDVAAAIAKRILKLDYSHFKDNIKSAKRHRWYCATWNDAYEAQLDYIGQLKTGG